MASQRSSMSWYLFVQLLQFRLSKISRNETTILAPVSNQRIAKDIPSYKSQSRRAKLVSLIWKKLIIIVIIFWFPVHVAYARLTSLVLSGSPAFSREIEKLFTTTTSAHSRLSLLLNNNNKAWCFVGKLEQVIISSYVLGTFHGIKNINVRKWNIVRVRPSIAVKFEFRAFADISTASSGIKKIAWCMIAYPCGLQ